MDNPERAEHLREKKRLKRKRQRERKRGGKRPVPEEGPAPQQRTEKGSGSGQGKGKPQGKKPKIPNPYFINPSNYEPWAWGFLVNRGWRPGLPIGVKNGITHPIYVEEELNSYGRRLLRRKLARGWEEWVTSPFIYDSDPEPGPGPEQEPDSDPESDLVFI